jgi:hypothetical protein
MSAIDGTGPGSEGFVGFRLTLDSTRPVIRPEEFFVASALPN